MASAEPTNRPAPITPAMLIIVTCRFLSPGLSAVSAMGPPLGGRPILTPRSPPVHVLSRCDPAGRRRTAAAAGDARGGPRRCPDARRPARENPDGPFAYCCPAPGSAGLGPATLLLVARTREVHRRGV